MGPTTVSPPVVPRAAERPRTLVDYFPSLASLPRAGLLGALPTPVAPSVVAPALWIKHDDLTAAPIGGNKVRALDSLRGGVRPGDEGWTARALGARHSLPPVVPAERPGAR